MQLSKIITNAKARFSILLTSDEEIQALLTQSLTAYQDLAGCLRSKMIDGPQAGGHPLPPSFLAHAMCADKYGNFVPVVIAENEDDGTSTLVITDDVEYPLTHEYLVNLAYYADDTANHIPNRIAGMITDHLECLIAMNSDERLARVESGGKMDTSRVPTTLDRIAQKNAIEDQFRANRAIISMASIHPL